MAVLLVLVILSISLALAYGVMRVQTTAEQVQANSVHRGDARQVAMSGFSIAVRKMNDPSWVGVNQTLTGSFNATDRYEITYTTGDPDLLLKLDPSGNLTAANVTDALVGTATDSEEILRYPYRVTVTVKGYSRNLGTGSDATHVVRGVFELAPQKMADQPTNWSKVTDATRNYVIYQRDDKEFLIHMPLQVRGNMRIHGELKLNDDYPGWQGIGTRYMAGLVAMNSNGTDHRPFVGQMFWNLSKQKGAVVTILRDGLGLVRNNLTDELLGDWLDTAPTLTYRLYPGGQAYAVTNIGSDISSTPDIRPLTNPLRIMYQATETRLQNNAAVKGTMFVPGPGGVILDGNNVRVDAFDLPKLGGQAAAVRLPSVVAKKMRQSAGRTATVTGMLSVDDEFRIDSGSQTSSLDFTGKIVAKEFRVRDRTEWKNASWGGLIAALDPLGLLQSLGLLDALLPAGAQSNYNAQYQPRFILKSDTNPTAIAYHWHTMILRGTPLYQEKSTGTGLRWNAISWKEGL